MSASASAGSSSRWHRRFPTPTSFEPPGPRSTVRLSEPSAHSRTPKSHDPLNNPANPPQRARSCAQMTGAGCGIGEINLPQHSIKWREKSGLAHWLGISPVVPVMPVPPMPMAVKADAPRTMVGPDHAAARVVIIIGVIIRIIVAADEVAMVVVREAEAAVMKPAMMKPSAVEAATSHMAASHVTAATTMSPAAAMSADFDHRCAGRGSCRGRRAWTDRRHGLGATAWRGGEQHHCCRNNAEAADKAAPWIGNPHACLLMLEVVMLESL